MTDKTFKRLSVSPLVQYVIEGRAHQDFIQNISDHGLFIETANRFSNGQRVMLTFTLSNTQKTVKVRGEIVRTTPKGFEVEFIKDKQGRGRNYSRKTEERRKRNRIRIKEGAFAVINKPDPMIGVITDISENGLAFVYSSQEKELSISRYLNILLVEDGLEIRGLPIKTRWESKISSTSRKKGVQFQRLNKRQRSQLLSVLYAVV